MIPQTSPFTRLDPRVKLIIKNSIEHYLYAPVQKVFDKQIERMVLENCRKQRLPHRHFVYKAETYNTEDRSNPMPLRKNRLLAEFHEAMEELLLEQQSIHQEEKPYVCGYITLVLNASNAPGDWLRLFPDTTHMAIKKVFETGDIKLDWYHTELAEEKVAQLREQHAQMILMMKQRMAINLILS